MANLDFHIVKRIREQVASGGSRIALKHKMDNEWQAPGVVLLPVST
ncbi:uncharacterized protein METZ01_LOCUS505782, partial [marine metagenome]